MKLDLARLMNAIASKGEGPGKPASSAIKALKSLQDKKKIDALKSPEMEDDDEMEGVVTERTLDPKAFQLAVEGARSGFVSPKQMTYEEGGRMRPESGDALKQLLVKEGIFQEKDGDFFMTPKGQKMKAAGQLKQYRLGL